VMILGVIQSLIAFDGSLSSWWTRIAIGVLLCAFCLMQRLLEQGGSNLGFLFSYWKKPAGEAEPAR
jgi:ribose/xylose/arabinose/galactoside ABC-type transport system permease subunit